MNPYLRLLRSRQWVKNLFVFAPLFFGRQLFKGDSLLSTFAMTVAFCLVSSAVYCLNDIIDVEADKASPLKCDRPLASGEITPIGAVWMMAGCLLFSVAVLLALSHYLFTSRLAFLTLLLPLVAYLLINVAYCLKLKEYALIDVSCIALGFVLRVLAGGIASGTWVSHWILIMTFLLTFFLAVTKRAGEMMHLPQTEFQPDYPDGHIRKSLRGYSIPFAYTIMAVMASVIIVCYILYTIDAIVVQRMGTPYLYATSVWVLLGLVRYMQLIMVFHKSEGPTSVFLGDAFLLFCAVGWLLSFGVIIYV